MPKIFKPISAYSIVYASRLLQYLRTDHNHLKTSRFAFDQDMLQHQIRLHHLNGLGQLSPELR